VNRERALQRKKTGYQELKGRREYRGEACDDVVVIARAAAGLSQTDGNLASVSGTLLGKHMPRESSPRNAYTACINTPRFGVFLQIGRSVKSDNESMFVWS
jgi:hypothetical protein